MIPRQFGNRFVADTLGANAGFRINCAQAEGNILGTEIGDGFGDCRLFAVGLEIGTRGVEEFQHERDWWLAQATSAGVRTWPAPITTAE